VPQTLSASQQPPPLEILARPEALPPFPHRFLGVVTNSADSAVAPDHVVDGGTTAGLDTLDKSYRRCRGRRTKTRQSAQASNEQMDLSMPPGPPPGLGSSEVVHDSATLALAATYADHWVAVAEQYTAAVLAQQAASARGGQWAGDYGAEAWAASQQLWHGAGYGNPYADAGWS